MKYKSDDILYYVNPFIFNIEVVKIEIAYKEDDGALIYIDSNEAYLAEEDLFDKYKDARIDALEKLNKFYHEQKYNILNNKPQLDKGL